jgi:hypothetical protein
MRLQQYLLSLIFVGLCTGTALAQTGAIPALFSRTLNLPVVGLASSETAQVNVVNLAAPVPAGTNGGSSPVGGATASCSGSITFYNSSGGAVGSSASFTIGSSQIFSATLPYSDSSSAGTSTSGRTAIRALVIIGATNSAATLCSLAANIETFDTATGVTHVHVDGTSSTLTGLLSLLPTDERQGAQR